MKVLLVLAVLIFFSEAHNIKWNKTDWATLNRTESQKPLLEDFHRGQVSLNGTKWEKGNLNRTDWNGHFLNATHWNNERKNRTQSKIDRTQNRLQKLQNINNQFRNRTHLNRTRRSEERDFPGRLWNNTEWENNRTQWEKPVFNRTVWNEVLANRTQWKINKTHVQLDRLEKINQVQKEIHPRKLEEKWITTDNRTYNFTTSNGDVIVGQIGYYDRLLFNKTYRKESRWWSSREKTIEYPKDAPSKYGWQKNEIITAIRIYNRFYDGLDSKAEVLSGGVGFRYVKIRLSSSWNKGFEYLVQIFGH